jgi:DNA mismatch endonuclease (patch repair protein)
MRKRPQTVRPDIPKRSEWMRNVRTSGTPAELTVRRVLSGLKIRYRLNARNLPGRPDISNRRHRFVIFVHGCYWHRHPGCKRASTPSNNREFWRAKFAENEARDRRVTEELKARGFSVHVIWECETENIDQCRQLLESFIHCDLPERK